MAGISNSITNQAGYPSSGEEQANKGTLPAQRAQAPFAHKMGGPLGPAVGGQQFKTNAQPMSSGVSTYVGIQSPQQFQPRVQATLPGMTPQPSYIADPNAGQGAQQGAGGYHPGYRPQPAYTPPTLTPFKDDTFATKYGQLGDQPPTPSFGYHPGIRPQPGADVPANRPDQYAYNADQTAWQVGHQYDKGGDWDRMAQIEMGRQEEQQMRALAAQSQLSGRGSDVAMVNSGYMNLEARGDQEKKRAMLQSQAMKDQFSMQLQQAEALKNAKFQAASLASQLGLNMTEDDFNKLAQEVVEKYGSNASPGQWLEALQNHNKGVAEHNADMIVSEAQAAKISAAVSSQDVDTLYDEIALGMNSNQVAAMLKKYPDWGNKIMDAAFKGGPLSQNKIRSIANALQAGGWQGHLEKNWYGDSKGW